MYVLLVPAIAPSSLGDLHIFGKITSRHLELATHRNSSNPPHPSSLGKYPAMRLQNSSCNISTSGTAIFFPPNLPQSEALAQQNMNICSVSKTNHLHCPVLRASLLTFSLAFEGSSIWSKIISLLTRSRAIPLKMTVNGT